MAVLGDDDEVLDADAADLGVVTGDGHENLTDYEKRLRL